MGCGIRKDTLDSQMAVNRRCLPELSLLLHITLLDCLHFEGLYLCSLNSYLGSSDFCKISYGHGNSCKTFSVFLMFAEVSDYESLGHALLQYSEKQSIGDSSCGQI